MDVTAAEPTWLSLLPALVTIALAFITRQVIPALFAGVVTGSLVLFASTGSLDDLNFITRFLFPAIGSKRYALILLVYLWCLGGLLGIWERMGAARYFAQTISDRFARNRETSLFIAWLLGVIFHQGGTVSTVLTGSTVKPITDRYRVSHEELAYVVDSTASPIATIVPFNAWPIYIAGLVAGTVPIIADEKAGYWFFISSMMFNFYAIFAVTSTLLLSFGKLPFMVGPIKQAIQRVKAGGPLDAPGAQPMLISVEEAEEERGETAEGYQPALVDFLLPLAVLLGVNIVPVAMGWGGRVAEAFMGATLTAMVVARVRGMSLSDTIDGFVDGCSRMTIGAIVLGLAVTVGEVAKDLQTADYVVGVVAGQLSPIALPALLTLLCMGIAFATGTSWGTYAVVFPVALPIAWALAPDPTYMKVCFGAVVGGAVFGDQCSPISDTTILSSMFTGCDMMDHVRTQLPLALVSAGMGVAASTAIAAFVV